MRTVLMYTHTRTLLRFCAMKLAEGSIGDVNALPDGMEPELHLPYRLSLIDDFSASTSFAKQQAQKEEAAHSQVSSTQV